MSKPDPIEAMRAADRALEAQGVPPDVDRRVRQRLRPFAERTSTPWPVWALGSAVAAAAVFVLMVPEGPARERTAPVAERAAPEDTPPACFADGASSSARGLRGGCAAGDLRVQVSFADEVELRRRADGIELSSGAATFSVETRRANEPPFVVRAAGARIEVLGTRFLVDVRAEVPTVVLLEGRIALERDGQPRRVMHAGESARLAVPPPPQPEPAVARAPRKPTQAKKTKKAQKAKPLAPLDEREALAELTKLRAQGAYTKALGLALRLLASRNSTDHRSAVYSAEVADLMRLAEVSPRRRCAHLRRHAKRFGQDLAGLGDCRK